MFCSCQQLFPVETWGTSLYRCYSWGLHSPLLHVNGDFPFCPMCTPPQFRGLWGSGHVLPLGGPLAPSPGNSVPGTLPHVSCQTLWVTLLAWCLRALAQWARMVGGRPFLLGWIVHNVNSETQHHIFIIVIKLYCTKMLGQYLWEEQTGM